MKKLFPFTGLFLFVFLLLPTSAWASSHYTYEHAEEMRVSGRIEWRDYGPDAFNEAIAENKPIFLLLTAPSWCYWCHVYTSDDYIYHPSVYPIINDDFIPIYVDADKRQDLTRKYLEGGWPSTTVLAPNRERLFGYSGPRPIQNMIANLNQAAQHVKSAGFATQISYDYKKTAPIIPTQNQLEALIEHFNAITLQAHDPVYGGFGNGQKFPQGRTLDSALDTYEAHGDTRFFALVQNTLKNQYTDIAEIATNYNLFDPIEGGFHRYGTRRDWTPPHYEKMLYDNAKLLRAYVHLRQITPNDAAVNTVVKKTDEYIKTQWYDKNSGGFYGNTDVHGEDKYYGKNPRPTDKPRVEKTKYSDWNAEAILTYLYLWQKTDNQEYEEIAERSLAFFSHEMVTEVGPYHFAKEDGTKAVRGNLLDSAYLLLAFTEGYNVLSDEQYIETAKSIADYSLKNLYDWNSGGFFERHSPDTETYAPGENIDLTKPVEENGIIAYALLNLYKQTNDVRYLNAGIKTLGSILNEADGLDRGYYVMSAAQFAQEKSLVSEYRAHAKEIETIEQGALKDYWVNGLAQNQNDGQATGFTPTDEGLEKLQGPMLLLLLIAFLAGLLSLASPCCLPILPAYVAYTFESSEKNVKGMSLSFFSGLALVFTLLGMGATFIGTFLKQNLAIFSQIAGIAIISFGVYTLLGKGFAGLRIRQTKPTTYGGAFVFGGIFGLAWTPCIGPILVAILILASTANSVFTGGSLLFAYAVGLAFPLVLFSHYLSQADRNGNVWRIIRGKELKFKVGSRMLRVHTTTLVSGVLFIVLGYLIFSGVLFAFNQYVGTAGFNRWIFSIENTLLKLVR